jgi:hypothetical protein
VEPAAFGQRHAAEPIEITSGLQTGGVRQGPIKTRNQALFAERFAQEAECPSV